MPNDVVFSFRVSILWIHSLTLSEDLIFLGIKDLLLFSCKRVLLESFSSRCARSVKVYSDALSLQPLPLLTLPLCVFGVRYSDTGQLCGTCL